MDKLTPFFKLIHNFFVVYLPNERRCSPNTVRSYRKAIELLLDFVKEKNNVHLSQISLSMITRDTISDFLDYLENERNCSVSTRNQLLHCIKAFYSYAANEDLTTIVHWEEIKKVPAAKEPQKLVEHMSENAIKSLLSQPDTSTEKGVRDMFIMLFLYKTGARVQELLDIRLRDIQFGQNPRVVLHGKGEKVRSVPLRENVVEHLKNYINLYHSNEGIYSEQYLFYSVRNGRQKRMTEQNIRCLVSKYGTMARKNCIEVPENVHPHLFRHSCAMILYQNGVDLTLISQWLGHSNLETTLIYAHADTEIKRKAIEKSIPTDSPLKEITNPERYMIDDENLLKRLCGLK